MKEWRYRDRWALVTGASAGLGEVFARRLAARGMHLVLSARREQRLLDLASQLRSAHGVQVRVIADDLSEPGAAIRLWIQATGQQPIHLLVNNAGFGARGRFDKVSLARQVDMVQLNCIAPMELSHYAMGAMAARGEGGIINVASIAAFQPVPELATYAATKAFVLNLSQALWEEGRDLGVRVLALCPGRTPTEFQRIAGTGSTEGAFGVRAPEQVVEAGLQALEQGKSYVVPGMENYLASWLTRVLPGSAVTRVLRRVIRKRAAQPDAP